MECAACRGLMLPDTKAARESHRLWHATLPDGVVHSPHLKHQGNTLVLLSCFDVAKLGGHYELSPQCGSCSEDLCQCTPCQELHKMECSRWAEMWNLFDDGDHEGADALACAILADRPASHKTSEDVHNATRS